MNNRKEHASFRFSTLGRPEWRSYEAVPGKDGEDEGEKKDRYVKVYRLAMVAWEGFDAVADMDVHHVRDMPADTCEEFLELVDPDEHRLIGAPKGGRATVRRRRLAGGDD